MERNLLYREICQSTRTAPQPATDHFIGLPLVAYANLSPGASVYLPVSVGGKLSAKTGVFLPAGFKPSAQGVNVVVYFHGMIISACQTDKIEYRKQGIEYYWSTPLFSCLRDEFSLAGTNTILIAPTLKTLFGHKEGTAADYGYLNRKGQFDTFLEACFRELIAQQYLPPNTRPLNIVLAGHSAGGLPMQSILGAQNSTGKKIVECWGFDSQYYSSESLKKWLKQPGTSYYHFGALTPRGGKSRPWTNADELARITPQAFSVAVPKGEKIYHCGIVKYWWGSRLKNCAALSAGQTP